MGPLLMKDLRSVNGRRLSSRVSTRGAAQAGPLNCCQTRRCYSNQENYLQKDSDFAISTKRNNLAGASDYSYFNLNTIYSIRLHAYQTRGKALSFSLTKYLEDFFHISISKSCRQKINVSTCLCSCY